jgi:menaquinone-dependent protoporphyrinogen oxidase
MTKVLVATASRHGATDEIARVIGEVLADAGLDVSVEPMSEVESLAAYDAFVLGSAIYLGKWLREARSFVEEHHELFSTRPTWLFSSGPVGGGLAAADPFDPRGLMELTSARDHCLVGGRLDTNLLGLRERAVVKLVHAEDGDRREWDTVAAWATAVSRALIDGQSIGGAARYSSSVT